MQTTQAIQKTRKPLYKSLYFQVIVAIVIYMTIMRRGGEEISDADRALGIS